MVELLIDDLDAGASGVLVRQPLLPYVWGNLLTETALSGPEAGKFRLDVPDADVQGVVGPMFTGNTGVSFDSSAGTITLPVPDIPDAEELEPLTALAAANTKATGTIANQQGVLFVNRLGTGGNAISGTLGVLGTDNTVQGLNPPSYGSVDGGADVTAYWKTESGTLPAPAGAYNFVVFIPRAVQATRPASVFLTVHNGATGEYAVSASMTAATALDTATHWAFGASDLALSLAAAGNPITIEFYTNAAHTTALAVKADDEWEPLVTPDVTDDTITGAGTHASPRSVATGIRYTDAKVDARVLPGARTGATVALPDVSLGQQTITQAAYDALVASSTLVIGRKYYIPE